MEAVDDENQFVTKTRHRRKGNQNSASTASMNEGGDAPGHDGHVSGSGTDGAGGGEGISLRPRNMFATKGKTPQDPEASPSPYRPQWRKEGDGFVSMTSKSSSGGEETKPEQEGSRRKNKVLRYSREELLALHVPSQSPAEIPEDCVVMCAHSLPPVGSLPFDFEEVYKQWAVNRNRGRGRGRGLTNSQSLGRTESGKWEDPKPTPSSPELNPNEDTPWERGNKVSNKNEETFDGAWDDVDQSGNDSNEMDLQSMAEAAERFRREMEQLKREAEGETADVQDKPQDLADEERFGQPPDGSAQKQDEDEETSIEWDMPEPAAKPVAQEQPISTPMPMPELELPSMTTPEPIPAPAPVLEIPKEPEMPTIPDEWFYLDPQGLQQGPFKTAEMREWFEAGYFKPHLPIRYGREGIFSPLASHFFQGQMPFAAPPRFSPTLKTSPDPQHHLRQKEHEVMQMGLQSLHLHPHHQEQQRLLQQRREEQARVEMQRLQIAHHHEQLLQQQHHQQQQQHHHHQQQQQQSMLLQPQMTSWQSDQRQSLMSALGLEVDPVPSLHSSQHLAQSSPLHQQQHKMLNPTNLFEARANPELASLLDSSSRCGWNEDVLSGLASTRIEPERPAPAPPLTEENKMREEEITEQVQSNTMSFRDIELEEKRRAAELARAQLATSTAEKSASPKRSTSTEQPSSTSGKGKSKTDDRQQKETTVDKNQWSQKSNKSTPSDGNKTKPLKDIQREEASKQKPTASKAEPVDLAQMGAKLKIMLGVNGNNNNSSAPPQQPQAHAAPTSAPSAGVWNTPSAQAAPASTKSLREILAEEERLALERSKKSAAQGQSGHWMNVVSGNMNVPAPAPPKPSRSLGPVPASVLKSTRSFKSTVGEDTSESRGPGRSSEPSISAASSDSSFWNFNAAGSGKPTVVTSGAQPKVSNVFGGKSLPNDFMSWCAAQLKSIGGVDDLTLIQYCASLEDPGEIREYLAAYLGSTPRVSAFATEFIQRKKQVVGMPKISPRPSSARSSSPSPNAINDAGNKNKRRTKGQKVDPALLNYSFSSS